MRRIRFNGMVGEVVESSPHGNYLVVRLCSAVYICGTYSNQFNWIENSDSDSGFIASLVYIGCNTRKEVKDWHKWIDKHDGWCKEEEDCRPAKRVAGFKLEIKVRNLDVDAIAELVNHIESLEF